MAIISKIILNYRLARLMNVFEEVIQECGSPWPEDKDGEGFGFTYLSQTRQAQIWYRLPRWVAPLRQYPLHTLTHQILSNANQAALIGMHTRYQAYINLYRYLQEQGIVMDLDKYASLYPQYRN